MKQFKKMLLMMMCVCVMFGCVACGNNNATDNGANQTENANGTDTTLDDANDNTMNDATDGTDNAMAQVMALWEKWAKMSWTA